MTVVCIIQARMSSTRFPGKVLADLCCRPVLGHVIDKCQRIVGIKSIIVAIPDDDDSVAIEEHAAARGIRTYRGSKDNVLRRYYDAAKWLGEPDSIMRITADCPMLQPMVCSDIVAMHVLKKMDYTSNVHPVRTYPKGCDCEVFTFDCLEAAHSTAKTAHDREHVTPWMQRTRGIKRLNVRQKRDDSAINWCVDEPRDITRLEAIMRKRTIQ